MTTVNFETKRIDFDVNPLFQSVRVFCNGNLITTVPLTNGKGFSRITMR